MSVEDLRSDEKSNELLIDAYCEEAIDPITSLQIWKGAAISSDRAKGNADYLIAERREYLDRPYLCVVEAKKRMILNKGWCNVELRCTLAAGKILQSSQRSRALASSPMPPHGNFINLVQTGLSTKVVPNSSGDPAQLLGVLNYIFTQCCP